jgi:peptidyl-tRNA hydrolase, PTH1 family
LKLIFGLGNPGKQYRYTRHNIGFLTADRVFEELDLDDFKEKYNSFYVKSTFLGEPCVLVKPLTFMNNSGRSVAPFLKKMNVEPQDMIVIHDDVDIEEGQVRIKLGGGDGGHKGLRSIIAETGGVSEFLRIRAGIGRPPAGMEVSDFVLDKVSKSYLNPLVEKSFEALSVLIDKGYQKACNLINQ